MTDPRNPGPLTPEQIAAMVRRLRAMVPGQGHPASMPEFCFAKIGTPMMRYIIAEFSGDDAKCDPDALRAAWETR